MEDAIKYFKKKRHLSGVEEVVLVHLQGVVESFESQDETT